MSINCILIKRFNPNSSIDEVVKVFDEDGLDELRVGDPQLRLRPVKVAKDTSALPDELQIVDWKDLTP